MAKSSGHLKLVEKTDVPPESIVDSHQSLFARAMAHSPINMCIGVLDPADECVYIYSDLESDFAESGFVMKMHAASSTPDDDSA